MFLSHEGSCNECFCDVVNSLRQRAISSSCTLLFKSLGLVRFFNVLERSLFLNAHQSCIYLIKNTVKTIILWKN